MHFWPVLGMPISDFEDLRIWNAGIELFRDIYQKRYLIKDLDIRRQILRSTSSVSANIAEGFDRGTTKEFIRFLNIARASLSESRSWIYLLSEIGAVQQDVLNEWQDRCKILSKMILAMIRSMDTRP